MKRFSLRAAALLALICPLAALAGQASFAGRANLRTWLTGILKHKIVDAIRRQAREPVVPGDADEEPGEIDELFSERGHWNERPAAWGDPDGALGYAAGLAWSLVSDLPAGPLIVCAMTALGILLFTFGPRARARPA